MGNNNSIQVAVDFDEQLVELTIFSKFLVGRRRKRVLLSPMEALSLARRVSSAVYSLDYQHGKEEMDTKSN